MAKATRKPGERVQIVLPGNYQYQTGTVQRMYAQDGWHNYYLVRLDSGEIHGFSSLCLEDAKT